MALLSAGVAALSATLVGLLTVYGVLGDAPPAARQDMLVVATLAGATTVLTVAIAVVVIVERMLASRLRELTEVVVAAQSGKFLARARSDRPDELGVLSNAFSRLCAQITDLSVAVIDNDRELDWARRELKLKEALSLLFELTRSINEELDLATILEAIPKKVAPALGFEQMAILLYDDAKDVFVVRTTFGFPEGTVVEGTAFSRGEGISGIVAKTGEPLVIADTGQDPRYLHYKGRLVGEGSFVCVPMKLQGRVTGLFNVLRPDVAAFSEQDVRLITSLASYTALAIAHAQMNLQLRALSVTDELTGAANRRLLMERAGRELERARRADKPLSALMIDLDHFKRINDTLGHVAGDEVLRAVSRVLQTSVRRLDTVARYGGEEFVVLLPDSGKAQAIAIAEKLREAVRDLALPNVPRLTVSIGVATLPDDAPTDQALIDAADQALFAAKRAGRDRVVAAGATDPSKEEPAATAG